MPKINILPKNIRELIAAGEVCERPASVVKELIENSVDAGADKITVEIRSGGVRYIRVTDNGSGLERGDVRTAFLSHATSKIATQEDLDSIYTLGFRGEALASVCSVSKTELLTKTAAEEFGTRYVIEGGQEILLDDAGCPQGTTIIVRDLFYNTPARMKFLKKDVTEGNYVSDAVSKAALARPEISFRLIKDDKEVLLTPGSGDLIEAVSAVYGREFASGLIPCEYELGGVGVKGLVSKPLSYRPNRNMQHFFVNSRYVKIPFAAAALDQAYKNSIMAGKFPSAVLFITVPAGTVDVNVHPAKTEVRFSDEKRVFEAVYYTAKNALSGGDSRPGFTFAGAEKKELKSYQDFLKKQPAPEQTFLNLSASEFRGANEFYPKSEAQITEKKEAAPLRAPGRPLLRDDSGVYASGEENILELCNSEARGDKAEAGEVLSLKPEACSLSPDPFSVIGAAFKTYIIVESGDKLLIVDKHAAHERMIFDSLRQNEKCGSAQLLLSPVNVSLSKKEYAAIIAELPLLNEAGFAVEDFGEGNVLVRECPLDLDYGEISSLITELAGYLCSHVKELQSEKLDKIYHSAACRAAVKAGSSASEYELNEFIKNLLADDNIRYCPHGRPVIVEMTRRELEKQFGRI